MKNQTQQNIEWPKPDNKIRGERSVSSSGSFKWKHYEGNPAIEKFGNFTERTTSELMSLKKQWLIDWNPIVQEEFKIFVFKMISIVWK